MQKHEAEGAWSACMHTREHVNSAVFGDFRHDLVLGADEFESCLRFRLVCTGSTEPIVRAVRNSSMLD